MKALRRDAIILGAAAAIVLVVALSGQTAQASSTGDASSTASSSGGFNVSTVNTTANQIIPKARPNVTTAYCDTTDQGNMRVYDNTTVCLVVGGIAKIYFYVNVDEFSLMQIVVPFGENTTGAFDNQKMWFQAEYSRAVSPMKYRQNPDLTPANEFYGYIVPFWTLIITLKDGVVEKMEWDDGCIGCKGDQCVEDTCTVSIAEVGCRDPGSKADCNPKFFIGWYGTDKDGVYLTSAGSRFSRFRQYSVSSAFSEAYQTASVDIAPVQNAKFTPSCTSDPTACES